MNDLNSLTERLRRARRTLDRQLGESDAITRTCTSLQHDINQLTAEVTDYARAAAVLTTIGEQRQADAQQKIEQIVTQGLQSIFGDDLSFHLSPTVRGNRPEVDFVVRSTIAGRTVDTPVMDARGGGLAAVIGFLLRVVVMLLSGTRDSVLILDETFAHLSAEYEPRLAEFLRELVDRTDIQIIMVTHSDAFSDLADTRYRFRLVDGVTAVETV
jgi:DNA repair ATPase RecN